MNFPLRIAIKIPLMIAISYYYYFYYFNFVLRELPDEMPLGLGIYDHIWHSGLARGVVAVLPQQLLHWMYCCGGRIKRMAHLLLIGVPTTGPILTTPSISELLEIIII